MSSHTASSEISPAAKAAFSTPLGKFSSPVAPWSSKLNEVYKVNGVDVLAKIKEMC